MVAIQPDVANARGRNEPRDALDHPKSGTQNGHERQLLSADALAHSAFQGRFDGCFLERELTGRLVGDERGDLVNKLLEDLCRGGTIAQNGELVLHERM